MNYGANRGALVRGLRLLSRAATSSSAAPRPQYHEPHGQGKLESRGSAASCCPGSNFEPPLRPASGAFLRLHVSQDIDATQPSNAAFLRSVTRFRGLDSSPDPAKDGSAPNCRNLSSEPQITRNSFVAITPTPRASIRPLRQPIPSPPTDRAQWTSRMTPRERRHSGPVRHRFGRTLPRPTSSATSS